MIGRRRPRFIATVLVALGLALPPMAVAGPAAQAAKPDSPVAGPSAAGPGERQVEVTIKDIVRQAERIAAAEGREVTADDIAQALLDSPSLGNRDWEQGVTFEVVADFSGGFGQVSVVVGPDGRIGVAIGGSDSCGLAVIGPDGVDTWTKGDLGSNCNGEISLLGPGYDPPWRDPVAPGAPTLLTATPGDQEVTVAWSAPADEDLATYEVLVAGGAAPLRFTVPATSTSYTVSNLVNGTSYTFSVVAVDTATNESPPSNELSAVPEDTVAPPTGLAIQEGDREITLTWLPVADADLHHYRVIRWEATAGRATAVTEDVPAGTTSLRVTGLVNLRSYVFAVVAVDASGNESAESDEVSGRPFDLTPPMAPVGLTLTPGNMTLHASWMPTTAPDLDHYRVRIVGPGVDRNEFPEEPSWSFANLVNGTTYTVTVFAVDDDGNESASSEPKSAMVAHQGTHGVIVGSRGTILTTHDHGANWALRLYDRDADPQTEPIGEELRAVEHNGFLWVAVGTRGKLLTSPNGITWTSRPSGTSLDLSDVTWTGERWIAVGDGGHIVASENGESWRLVAGAGSDFYGVESNGSLVVAVGNGHIQTSPTGLSTTWTVRREGLATIVEEVAWNGAMWLAVARNDYVYRSHDGIQWTRVDVLGAGSDLKDATWDGTKWLVVGQVGRTYTSSDAVTWSFVTNTFAYAAIDRDDQVGEIHAVGWVGMTGRWVDPVGWAVTGSPIHETGVNFLDVSFRR